jgi:hypothetical protein
MSAAVVAWSGAAVERCLTPLGHHAWRSRRPCRLPPRVRGGSRAARIDIVLRYPHDIVSL